MKTKKMNTVKIEYVNCKNNCIISRADNSLITFAGNSQELIIPEGVETIKTNCFRANKKLKSIIIPDSVTNLGDSAFMNCSNLNTCVLSNNLTEILKDTFSNCTSL